MQYIEKLDLQTLEKILEIGIELPKEIKVIAPNCASEEDIVKVVRPKAKWIKSYNLKLFNN